ncbi:nitrite transporter NirC [Propionivibrio limicola]|uniref:nitrite transporter NirC n=1 Tax=Propionivibrio limicola TaxID=167645 RepID=UPI0012916D34|nr:nitrite transporter NirC [Propionivibrio limicola]
MYLDTVDKFAELAAKKVKYQKKSPGAFFVGAMMAGAYVGLAIILIFTLGNDVDPASRRLVMGTSFGIALTLVIFAGSELFTGYTMYMSIGWLRGRTTLADLFRLCSMTWLGNLAGALLVSSLFIVSGGGNLIHGSVLYDIVGHKMHPPAIEIFAKGMLCNWLVCLAVWTTSRTTNDAAKCLLIFWCLFAFIASGYEHSVANMTGLTIGVLGGGDSTVNLAGWGHNLLWSTLGNATSGILFMGVGYWYASRPSIDESEEAGNGQDKTAALGISAQPVGKKVFEEGSS